MTLDWTLPPAWLPVLVLIAVAAVLWVRRHYRQTEPPATPRLRRLLIALRAAAVVLLLWAAAGPSLHRSESREQPPEAVAVVEDSASMGLRDELQGPDRWEQAHIWTVRIDSLLGTLAPGVKLTVLRGNGAGAPVAVQAGRPWAAPTARGTDLGALAAAAARGWSDRNLRALFLITDGQETASEPAAALAPTDGAMPVLIGVGDPEGPPDLELRDLRYPDAAFVGDKVVVEAVVGIRGAPPGTRLRVALVQDADTLATATATPAPDDASARVELSFTPETPGLQLARLVIAPLVNERYHANNEASLAVAVRKERSRLLLITARPDWNVRTLAQAAAGERRLRLDTAYPSARGMVLADSAGVWTPPGEPSGWAAWDGVVLTGGDWGSLPVDWATLATAVRDGCGLLVIPGGRTLAPPAGLAALLPVKPRAGVLADDFALRPAPGETGHPLLSGISTDVADWSWLPPLDDLTPVTALPGARTVLVAVPARGGPGLPVLVVREAGRGTVTWFGSSGLWSQAFWQPPRTLATAPDQPLRRLARNLLVWTASGGDLAGVTIAGQRNLYREGEAIRLETRTRGLRGEGGGGDAALSLRAVPDTAAAQMFSLTPVPGEPGRSRVTLPPLPPGRYAVRPVAAGGDSALGPAKEFVVVAGRLEETQVRQDRRRLRALAASWGGRYVDGNSAVAVSALADLVRGADWSPRTLRRHVQRSLWAGWPLIAVATLLLGFEWGLRRARGML